MCSFEMLDRMASEFEADGIQESGSADIAHSVLLVALDAALQLSRGRCMPATIQMTQVEIRP